MNTEASDAPQSYVTAAQYNELLLKHEALRKAFHEYRKAAEDRSLKAASKIRDSKETILKWKEYIDKKLAKQALRDANRDFATPRAVQTSLETFEHALTAPLPHPALDTARNTSTVPPQSPVHSKVTSSQTTEGEARSSSIVQSGDSPIVVSVKTLKRRRVSPRKDAQAYKVKNELLSSSPHNSHIFTPTLLRTETSYLDRPVRQQSRATLGDHPFSKAPLQQLADRALNATTELISVKTEPGLSNVSAAKENMLHRTTSKSVELQEARVRNNPLHDLNPNTPTLPRTSVVPASSGKKRIHRSGADAVHMLSEDGDIARHGPKKARIDDGTPKTKGTGRLHGLLEGTSFQGDRTILSPRSAPTVRRHGEVLDHHTTKSVEKPVGRVTRTVHDKPSPRVKSVERNKEKSEEESGTVLPEHEPLRARPLHRLGLDDFRVNPKTNGNLGYAFRESVRKREEKKCLPGCTREECCGAIRRFIAAGGLPQDTSLSDDELTLQGYLGPAFASIIHTATEAAKQDMLIEARAKAFADRHGKHREMFQRRSTPPGFWRTEMPTTQELEQDWEDARIQERQKVEERWRDAMRGGGRYMFRDEA
jgi:hypothetical protein